MQLNTRIYIRCLHKSLIEENAVISMYKYIRRIIETNCELINQPKKISKTLLESKNKLQKARNIIEANTVTNKTNFFNLVK